jgi:hypothetical protein
MILYLAFVISLILLPIGILVFVQVRFLPYHSEWVTSWHRGLVFADLILIWLLWPRIVRASGARPPPEPEETGPLPRRWGDALRRSLADSRAEATRRGSSTAIVICGQLAAWARNEAGRFPGRIGHNPGLLTMSLVTAVFVSLIVTIPQSDSRYRPARAIHARMMQRRTKPWWPLPNPCPIRRRARPAVPGPFGTTLSAWSFRAR